MPIINQVVKGGGSSNVFNTQRRVVSGALTRGTSGIDLAGVTEIGSFSLISVQNGNTSCTGAAFSNSSGVTTIRTSGLASAFVSSGVTSADLSGVTFIEGNALNLTFRNCYNFTSYDLSNLETINGDSAMAYTFGSCPLQEISLPKLSRVTGQEALSYTFSSNNSLRNTIVNLNNLEYVYGVRCLKSTFWSTNVTEIHMDNLVYVGGTTPLYSVCSSAPLDNISLNSLCIIDANAIATSSYPAFWGDTITSLSLGGLNSLTFVGGLGRLNYITSGGSSSGLTIHFPSNFDPDDPNKTFDITTLTGYPTFGGNANYTTLAYDLPASYVYYGADTKGYARFKKYDTATALAWLNQTDKDTVTKYYTSGTTLPSVGDTIYSDAACTTAVTTISSIA